MLVALLLFAPKAPDAWEILQQSIAAYRSLKSYSDEGVSTVRGPNGPEDYPLKTKYLQGKGAVVRWQTRGETETVWSSGGETFHLVQSKDLGGKSSHQVIVHLSRYETSGNGIRVPDPDASRTRWLSDLLTSNLTSLAGLADRDRSLWHLVAPEKVDGAKCDVISFGQTRLFLDAKSHLVRRIEAQTNGAIPIAIQVKPKANGRVIDRDAEFLPPNYEYSRLPAPKDKATTYAGASHGFKTYDDIVETVSEHYLYDNLQDDFSVMSDGFAGPFAASSNHFVRRADGAFCLSNANPSGSVYALWGNGIDAKEWSVIRSQDVSLYSLDRQENAEGAIRRAILRKYKEWPVPTNITSQVTVRYETVNSTFSVTKVSFEGRRAYEVRTVRTLRPSLGPSKDIVENLRWLVGEDGLPILEEWREGTGLTREPFHSVKHSAHLIPKPRWNQIEFRPAPVDLLSLLPRRTASKQD